MSRAGLTAPSVPRWAVSFADLGLLLLGCFVLLHAMEAQRPTAAAGSTAAAMVRGDVLVADEAVRSRGRAADRSGAGAAGGVGA